MGRRWLLTIAAIAGACAAAGGCSLDDCSPGTSQCAGDTVQVGEPEDGTSFFHWRSTDCAPQGQTCRQGGVAECVFADRPCTASVCTAGEAVDCGSSGFVTGTETCDADATCEVASGRVACVYTGATCPAGVDEFCAADGVTILGGCDEGFGAATRREVCSPPSTGCVAVQNRAWCGS